MRFYVGTSGFSYKEWKGSFYPDDLPQSRFLNFYSRRFDTVEINNTFYRMPTPKLLQGWLPEVPDGFQFVLKAPQIITHIKRLKDVEQPVEAFCTHATTLGAHLGPLLFQLPPNMKIDLARLQTFLAFIPKEFRVAVEFRHASWFDESTYAILRLHNAALCVAEAENLQVPLVATADWGYLRMREIDYTAAELKVWADDIKKQPFKDVFVFFKHEDEGKGPAFAETFKAQL